MDNILDTIIKISSALLTPTLAIVGAFILVNQFRLQKLRWRVDVYDKRYPVFINTMEYLSHIVQHHNISNEVLFKFLRGSKDKEFLFGENIKKYLEELYLKGLDLQLIAIELKNVPVGKKRDQMVGQSSEIFKWFMKRFDVSKRLFAEYLAVSAK